ncbi:hypothetical protein KIN20_028590 [Parelaphostrongylus tenuis]|uniref:Metallo-beta-lactamase domain-containing protein n=1 Tax=Parelaphostrongylus tenuis TaxID=148309 RepID=A0AAD5WEU0_PARTN|nr:hypothetical protein KIN20_028590 [Parelaphostrongylus tenuis]
MLVTAEDCAMVILIPMMTKLVMMINVMTMEIMMAMNMMMAMKERSKKYADLKRGNDYSIAVYVTAKNCSIRQEMNKHCLQELILNHFQVPIYKMWMIFMYDWISSLTSVESFELFTLDDVDEAFDRIQKLKFNQTVVWYYSIVWWYHFIVRFHHIVSYNPYKGFELCALVGYKRQLAQDTVTQTKVQPVATWKCNQPLQKAKVVATRKFDASSTKVSAPLRTI